MVNINPIRGSNTVAGRATFDTASGGVDCGMCSRIGCIMARGTGRRYRLREERIASGEVWIVTIIIGVTRRGFAAGELR